MVEPAINEPAKKRGGWVRRLVKRFAIGTSITFLVTYTVFAVPFFSRSPQIKKHYVRDYNATIAAIPEDQRAWPEIRRAKVMRSKLADPWPENLHGAILTPDSQDWTIAKDLIERRSEALGVLATAASRPRLGYALTDKADPLLEEDLPLDVELGEPHVPGANEDIPMMNVLFMHLGTMRSFGRDLCMRMVIRAEAGDGQGVLQDFTTILNLARLAGEPPSHINSLVRVAICARAESSLAYVLSAYPGLLQDGQLADAQRQFETAAGWIVLEDAWERDQWLDEQQRIFSDDGAGDGRLTFTGMRYEHVQSATNRHVITLAVTGPFVAQVYGTRREFTDAIDTMLAANRQDWERPVWERAESLAEIRGMDLRLPGSPRSVRWVGGMGEAYAKHVQTLQVTRQAMQAAVVWLGIERYRVRFGRPPASLHELKDFGVAAIPTDIFSGHELGYAVTDGNAVLYSVGTDGDDDGGVPTNRPFEAQVIRSRERLEYLSSSNPDYYNGDWIFWPEYAEIDGDRVDRVVRPRRTTQPATK